VSLEFITGQRAAAFGRELFLTLLLLCGGTLPAMAHRANDAWLQLTVTNQSITLQLDLPLRDLDAVLGLDTSDDGNLTWGELRRREGHLNEYITRHVTLTNTHEKMLLVPEPLRLVNHEDVMCASLLYTAESTRPFTHLTLTYRCLFDLDPQHRALVQAVWAGASVALTTSNAMTLPLSTDHFTGLLSPAEPSVTFFQRGTESESTRGAQSFFWEGVHHIGSGYDHLLFLTALLLPSVLRRTPDGWQAAKSFREALTAVVQVVTAFTIAHSLTLAAAAAGVARPPSRLIESAIAASVLYAALINLRSRSSAVSAPGAGVEIGWRRVTVPFVFGLIHGFGFANALGELGLTGIALALPLLGFNLGVEAGQLAGVAVFFPIAFALRTTTAYRRGVLPVGSILIALIATAWLIDRAFALGRMPF